MILGQVSWADCIVFLVLLAPQLVGHVGFWRTCFYAARALPFLLLHLPFQLVRDRHVTTWAQRSPFVQRASYFEDLAIRCIRYAFAEIPADICRVFFSKAVALPFFGFRLLRHGHLASPMYWREVDNGNLKGLWIVADPQRSPDVIVYYVHGGGFSMGSPYFYLEFLIGLVHLIRTSSRAAQLSNPALFALDYTLVPDATFPTQLRQTRAGYEHVLSIISDPLCIIPIGDSAGATLILSLLLHLGRDTDSDDNDQDDVANTTEKNDDRSEHDQPGFAVLISPWATLLSPANRNTPSDYINDESLHQYARQYAGAKVSLYDAIVSPGMCRDEAWWRRAAPSGGIAFMFGSEEVLAPETRRLVGLMQRAGVDVVVREEHGAIHAWPVAALFLSDTGDARLRGLRDIVDMVGAHMDSAFEKIVARQ